MKIKLAPYDDHYPANSTRFILPTVAIRGWWKNGQVSVTAAFWIWRLRWNILMVLTLGLATFAVVWTILGRLRVEMAGWGFEQGVAIIGLVLLVVMFLVGAVNFVRKNRIRA